MSMFSLVAQAAKHGDKQLQSKDLIIKVVGCGGGGTNTISRLHRIGNGGAETIALNTDHAHLYTISADKKILIGKIQTRGLGTGGDPMIGEKAAYEARDEIRKAIGKADIVFVTVGMGGGTGTGSAPVVAEVAKEMGAIVIGVATSPFKFERSRQDKALKGLENLSNNADCVIILDNNRLLQIVPKLPMDQAFSVMDQLISEVLKGITETVTQPSLINIDFADIKTIMSQGGTSTILYGESADDTPELVVSDTLKNPLLDIDYTGAKGGLLHITGGPNLTLKTVHEVVEGITNQMDPNANLIFGARVDPDMEGTIKVIAIMTGVKSAQLLGPKNPQVSPFIKAVNEMEWVTP